MYQKFILLVTFAIVSFQSIAYAADKVIEKAVPPKEDPIADDGDKRGNRWPEPRSPWAKHEQDYEDLVDILAPRESRATDWQGLQSAWGKRADWQGLQSAWGKRGAEWQGLQSAWGKRAANWEGLQSAWGKRADWKGLQAAWGKRTPAAWDDEYMQNIKRKMEAMKNRRSNWQSLASWGKRR